jgi:hypothetical protein
MLVRPKGLLSALPAPTASHARRQNPTPTQQVALFLGSSPVRRRRRGPPGYTFLRLNLLDFLVLVLCARLLLDLSRCPLQLLTRRSVEILFVLDVPATSRSDPLEIPIAVRVVQPLRTRGAVETQKKVQT